MICKICNKKIDDNSKYCHFCGEAVQNNDQKVSEENLDKSLTENKINKKIIFGAKYSRLTYWIISIILLFIGSFFLGIGNTLVSSNAFQAAKVSYFISFIIDLIWINTLSNRIRDYGNNPWLSLFALLPLVNLILGFYYGIKNKKINL